MKNDWENIHFSFVPYKDTGISILSSPEDIQVLLDDHIVKTTTMKGSPFIEPFEAAVNEWDNLLVGDYMSKELHFDYNMQKVILI
jgi:dynein heavy chain